MWLPNKDFIESLKRRFVISSSEFEIPLASTHQEKVVSILISETQNLRKQKKILTL